LCGVTRSNCRLVGHAGAPIISHVETNLEEEPVIYSNSMADLWFVSRAVDAFVQEHDLTELPCGRYELGDGDFVNVMEYTSKLREEACYESHEEYVDIQTVLRGAELIEVAPVEELEVTSSYTEDGAFALYSGAAAGEVYVMEPGRWCLVMPEDGHMPGVAPANEPASVKKAVFKVLVEHLGA